MPKPMSVSSGSHATSEAPCPPSRREPRVSVSPSFESTALNEGSGSPPFDSGPSSAAAFVCNFDLRVGQSEASLIRAVALFLHPPMPGLTSFQLLRKADGCIAERFVFDSAASLRRGLDSTVAARAASMARLKYFMDPSAPPVMWIGPAADVPTALWPTRDEDAAAPVWPCPAASAQGDRAASFGASSGSTVSDSDSSSEHAGSTADGSSATSAHRAPAGIRPSPMSRAVGELAVQRDPAWTAMSASARSALLELMSFWQPVAACRPAGGIGMCRLLLDATPARYDGTLQEKFTRPMLELSAPRFRFQHAPYDAVPVVHRPRLQHDAPLTVAMRV